MTGPRYPSWCAFWAFTCLAAGVAVAAFAPLNAYQGTVVFCLSWVGFGLFWTEASKHRGR